MNRSLRAALFLALFVLAISAQADIRFYGGGGSSTPPAWTDLFEASDQTLQNDQTVNADATLTFAALANKTYVFESVLDFTDDSTTGVRWTIQCPSSPGRVSIDTCVNGSATSFVCPNTATACASELTNASTNATYQVVIKGRIANGSNAGTINLAWAQNATGAATLTLRAGSYMRYRQVN